MKFDTPRAPVAPYLEQQMLVLRFCLRKSLGDRFGHIGLWFIDLSLLGIAEQGDSAK